MYSARSEDIYMNDEEIRIVKSLQDGGTYIVRFKDGIRRKDAEAWMKFLRLTLLGRNIKLIPESPYFFEIVGESIEKIK
jgi:hypothetical protein